jgi:hypothetical protein
VRHVQCQLRGIVPPTPVRITRCALERGPATPSNHFLVNLQGQAMTLGRRNAISSLLILCGRPHACSTMPGTATTTPAQLGTRGRDAATPATVTRTDHRQRLPRARLRTLQPTTTPSPSKPPLFKYGMCHDDKTGARAARTAADSPVMHAIPLPVAKQCGTPVNRPILGL